MADVTTSTSHTTSSVFTLKNNLPTPEKKTSPRKRKTKCSVHLTSDQNLEETQNKKYFSQQEQNEQPAVRLIS